MLQFARGLCLCLAIWATSPLLLAEEGVATAKTTISFTDPIGVVELASPPIGEKLEQSERELAPKLCKEIRFVSKDGPAAVLISTRVRADLPRDDRVLERIEPKHQAFKKEHGADDVHVEFRGTPPNRTLEFAVAGGEYQDTFPFVVGGHIGTDVPPKSITISQFFISSGRMFEVALFLPNADQVDRKDLFIKARAACDEWRGSVAIKP